MHTVPRVTQSVILPQTLIFHFICDSKQNVMYKAVLSNSSEMDSIEENLAQTVQDERPPKRLINPSL